MMEKWRQADFVLCIGDDRSDEDMFENIDDIMKRNIVVPKTPLFACTVGRKPSKARFYLDYAFGVVNILSLLADASEPAHVIELEDDLATYVSSIDISDEPPQLGNRRDEGS
jgi:trehalose 6-phosphate synthase/phosphatase